MSKKNIRVAANPINIFSFVTSIVPRSSLRLISNTRSIFYEFSPSGMNRNRKNKLSIPHIMDTPAIELMKMIKAIEPIGARPSGVED